MITATAGKSWRNFHPLRSISGGDISGLSDSPALVEWRSQKSSCWPCSASSAGRFSAVSDSHHRNPLFSSASSSPEVREEIGADL